MTPTREHERRGCLWRTLAPAGTLALRPHGNRPKPSPAQADRFYLPELDALRFFAFLVVFLGHGVVISGLWARETGWLHDAIGFTWGPSVFSGSICFSFLAPIC